MDRRKDTEYMGEKLPKEYLEMISDVFLKNFKENLQGKGKNKETFVIFGEIYPDELLIAISLKNPENLRMTTCYGSMDFPPASIIPESGNNAAISGPSVSEAVQTAVSQCIDVIGSFFQTYFEEERPVDYDMEYKQEWSIVELDKTTKVYIKLNRDNLELEAASDEFLAQHAAIQHRNELIAEETKDEAPAEEVDPDEAEEEDDDEEESSEETTATEEEHPHSDDEDLDNPLPGEPQIPRGTKKKTVH